MISFWPTRIRFGSLMLFAAWIAATVTPYLLGDPTELVAALHHVDNLGGCRGRLRRGLRRRRRAGRDARRRGRPLGRRRGGGRGRARRRRPGRDAGTGQHDGQHEPRHESRDRHDRDRRDRDQEPAESAFARRPLCDRDSRHDGPVALADDGLEVRLGLRLRLGAGLEVRLAVLLRLHLGDVSRGRPVLAERLIPEPACGLGIDVAGRGGVRLGIRGGGDHLGSSPRRDRSPRHGGGGRDAGGCLELRLRLGRRGIGRCEGCGRGDGVLGLEAGASTPGVATSGVATSGAAARGWPARGTRGLDRRMRGSGIGRIVPSAPRSCTRRARTAAAGKAAA